MEDWQSHDLPPGCHQRSRNGYFYLNIMNIATCLALIPKDKESVLDGVVSDVLYMEHGEESEWGKRKSDLASGLRGANQIERAPNNGKPGEPGRMG